VSEATNRPLLRVIFDCNIYLQAAASSGGPAFACLEMAEQGLFSLVISADILSEVREVLNRVSVQKKIPKLTSAVANRFLVRVTEAADLVSPVLAAITFYRDPKDEPYLNLALAAGASIIVTRDNDMLDLALDESAEGTLLRNAIPGFRVLDPASFLREMRARTGE
jgi:putative PIN family toxin of toxin-antitoxin system